MIELQQQREQLFYITQKFQKKMKEIFDSKTNLDDFRLGDVVLLWDAPHEEKGKHDKFDNLWKGPYNISSFRGNNAYILEEMEGCLVSGAPANGRILKHYSL